MWNAKTHLGLKNWVRPCVISSLSTWQIMHLTNFRRFGGEVILKPEGLSCSLLAMEINLKNAPIYRHDTPITVVFYKTMKKYSKFVNVYIYT